MFKEIRDERAFNGILNQIIENIQNGSLKAGDALPAERTMAEIMGVSRPAVREALRALELLGIVKPVPGGGNYITEDLDNFAGRMGSLLFKQGVDLNVLGQIIAYDTDIDEGEYQRLRGRAIRDMKRTNGRISFKDALDFQKSV